LQAFAIDRLHEFLVEVQEDLEEADLHLVIVAFDQQGEDDAQGK
jgi:hypothetical protein